MIGSTALKSLGANKCLTEPGSVENQKSYNELKEQVICKNQTPFCDIFDQTRRTRPGQIPGH